MWNLKVSVAAMLGELGQPVLALNLLPLQKNEANIPVLLGYCGTTANWSFFVILTMTSITLITRGQVTCPGHLSGRVGTRSQVCTIDMNPSKGSCCD